MKKTLLTVLIVILSVGTITAQESKEELSKKAANPIANLMSFPFQNNTNFNLGSYDRTSNVLNVQPVIPLMGGKLITRTIIPFVWMMIQKGVVDFLATIQAHDVSHEIKLF